MNRRNFFGLAASVVAGLFGAKLPTDHQRLLAAIERRGQRCRAEFKRMDDEFWRQAATGDYPTSPFGVWDGKVVTFEGAVGKMLLPYAQIAPPAMNYTPPGYYQ